MAGTKKERTPEEREDEYWYVKPSAAAVVREAAELPPPETGEDSGDGDGKNTNAGHRARLRERFRRHQGFDGFSEHEILELLLTYGSPRRDTKALAKNLLDAYGGNLKNVFEARPEQLMKVEGIGEIQATLVSMMLPLTREVLRCEMNSPRQIANRRELEKYCLGMQMGNRNEEFWVICVNAQCRVLGCRRIATGSLSEVSAYPRLVMEAALDYNAHSVFFCHNHPGGTCAPSAEDIASTLQLKRMLDSVEIMLLDHMIVAGAGTYSMAQHGDIDFGARRRQP